ncbi:Gfo/Idh/MocA family protein [Aliifodinibius salipaludis]|nr:Gfo/Idh/MocA family oxidoreductase [Aliifodinibius salipaludis]
MEGKIRYGMVGGGPNALIGEVHRMAARLDGNIELVSGVFSSDSQKSVAFGSELQLSEDRLYDSYQKMAEKEADLPEEKRIDFVVVVTPNHLHFDVCRSFIKAGIHVVCDKPMTNTMEEAEELCRLVEKNNTIFALTHNYSGYPMVKEAKSLVNSGKLGNLRKVVVEYSQGWLSQKVEEEGNKQASWRTDPDRAGISSTVADIGSHAEHLVEYITGLQIEELYADINTFVEGRPLEDDANMLVHYEEGVRGVLISSQVSVGEENNLNIRIYGNEASLEWKQENPNYLRMKYPDKPEEIYKKGNLYLSALSKNNTRIPPGHPEGLIGTFANIYSAVADAIVGREDGDEVNLDAYDFPTVYDGLEGVRFIRKAIESGKKGVWVKIDDHVA